MPSFFLHFVRFDQQEPTLWRQIGGEMVENGDWEWRMRLRLAATPERGSWHARMPGSIVISTASSDSKLRCVLTSNCRIDSTVSPNNSIRTG